MDAKDLLFVALTIFLVFYIVLFTRSVLAARREPQAGGSGHRTDVTPTLSELVVGFVTNFFDTLGIGSFATTTAAYKLLKMVPDDCIPGTMIIGHALPATTQAL